MLRVAVAIPWVMLAGCSEWPRLAHLPDAGDPVDAAIASSDLVEVTWTVQSEGAVDNDQPVGAGVTPLPLGHGAGLILEGTLDGVGWADALVPEVLTDPDCGADEGTRSPLAQGDYLGDVDFYLLEIPQDGTLCVRARTDQDSVGWDLVPQPVNACGIPLGPLLDDDGEPVGVNLGGASAGYAVNVAPGRYVLGFAGYAPNDPDLVVDYALAVSIVQPLRDGSPGVCPNPPEGGAR